MTLKTDQEKWEAILALLRKLEWQPHDLVCPICHRKKPCYDELFHSESDRRHNGHSMGCELRAAIDILSKNNTKRR
jgi:hypothetical protein